MEILQHSATFFIRKIACLFSFYSIVQVFSFSFFGVGVFGRGCGVIRYICNVNECRNPSKTTSFTNFLGFVTCYCSFLCKIILFKLLYDKRWFFFSCSRLTKFLLCLQLCLFQLHEFWESTGIQHPLFNSEQQHHLSLPFRGILGNSWWKVQWREPNLDTVVEAWPKSL